MYGQVEERINVEIAELYAQCNVGRNRQNGSLVETRKELLELVKMLKKWGYHLHSSDAWVTSKIKAAQAEHGHPHLSHSEFRYWFHGQIVADEFNRRLLLQRTGCSEKDGGIHAGLNKTTVVETSPKPGASASQVDSTPMVMMDDLSSNAYIVRTPHRRSHGAMRRSSRA